MIFQFFLVIVFLGLMYYAMQQRKESYAAFLIIELLCFFGLIASIFPHITAYFAALAGVGRGVDLLFYLYMVIALIVAFRYYILLRKFEQQLTILARLQAIQEVIAPGKNGQDNPL